MGQQTAGGTGPSSLSSLAPGVFVHLLLVRGGGRGSDNHMYCLCRSKWCVCV
jgi:hypothetical protein